MRDRWMGYNLKISGWVDSIVVYCYVISRNAPLSARAKGVHWKATGLTQYRCRQQFISVQRCVDRLGQACCCCFLSIVTLSVWRCQPIQPCHRTRSHWSVAATAWGINVIDLSELRCLGGSYTNNYWSVIIYVFEKVQNIDLKPIELT